MKKKEGNKVGGGREGANRSAFATKYKDATESPQVLTIGLDEKCTLSPWIFTLTLIRTLTLSTSVKVVFFFFKKKTVRVKGCGMQEVI